MNTFRKVCLLGACLAAFTACKSEFEALLNSHDVDAKYRAAFEYFNQKKYSRAAQLFENLSFLTNGTERDDTVQYYWGLSNYRYKDYLTAQTNFSRFLENYPRSPFAEDARFLYLDCLYRSTYRWELDQTPTYACLQALIEYMAAYPEENARMEVCRKMARDLNERLDRKAYENAKLYYKMEDYLAARVALRNVLKDDSENMYREEILYYTAMASYNYARLSVPAKQRERYLTFIDDYYNFIGELPDSRYRRELDALYRRAQRALGRYTGGDEDLDTKAKDFERERRQQEKDAKKNETREAKEK